MAPGPKRQKIVKVAPLRRIPQQPRGRALELKGVDNAFNETIGPSDMATSVDVMPINLVAPGTGSWNRIGRQIIMKSLRYNGIFVWTRSADATVEYAWIRQVLVWDLQPSGALPVKSDIFGYTPQNGTESSNIYAQIRYDTMGRFKILRDDIMTLNVDSLATTAATSLQQVCHFDNFVDLGIKKTTYQGQSTPATIGDISTGALYLVTMSSLTIAEGASLIRRGDWRLRFTD